MQRTRPRTFNLWNVSSAWLVQMRKRGSTCPRGALISQVVFFTVLFTRYYVNDGRLFASKPLVLQHDAQQSRVTRCPTDVLAEQPGWSRGAAASFHGFTNRSISEHAELHPPWILLQSLLEQGPTNFRLLEIGAGNGRALLQLQAEFPEATLFGSNYGAYETAQRNRDSMHDNTLFQASSQEDLFTVARALNLPMVCQNGKNGLNPILPNILMLPSFDEPGFSLEQHLPWRDFDWIISFHALNNKLEPSRNHVYFASLAEALAPGGTALIHVSSLYGAEMTFERNAFRTLAAFGDEHPTSGISAFLYSRGVHVGIFIYKGSTSQRAKAREPFLRTLLDPDEVMKWTSQLAEAWEAVGGVNSWQYLNLQNLLDKFGDPSNWQYTRREED